MIHKFNILLALNGENDIKNTLFAFKNGNLEILNKLVDIFKNNLLFEKNREKVHMEYITKILIYNSIFSVQKLFSYQNLYHSILRTFYI